MWWVINDYEAEKNWLLITQKITYGFSTSISKDFPNIYADQSQRKASLACSPEPGPALLETRVYENYKPFFMYS